MDLVDDDRIALEIIDRALSIRPTLNFTDIKHSAELAQVPHNASLARLILAHLDELKSEDAEKFCAEIICAQKDWESLCGELIRYSIPSSQTIRLFMNILRSKSPGHPLCSYVKNLKPHFTIDAFGAQVVQTGLRLRMPSAPVTNKTTKGVLISIDKPTGWYTTIDKIDFENQYATLYCGKDGDLFSDNTIVIRPAVFSIFSK